MRPTWRSLWGLTFLLLGCPPVNSKPCSVDTECSADQRCRRGACGPICVDDSECGDAQVCRSGVCKPRPECAADVDCASGFVCQDDRCQCTADTSCGSNQQCLNGSCGTKPPCRTDADCLGKGRCEVTQGVCLPVCVQPADCAPQLDPRVALALYACLDGTCSRRCATDVTCGGQGLICASNICRVADCKTLSDCGEGQYCTSAAFGRCATFTTCSNSTECTRNWECKKFDAANCPPGFDCTRKLCLELPACLTDADCITGLPGTPTANQTGYCAEGHCQPTVNCEAPTQCGPGQTCIAEVCVPSVCRGHAECGAGKACVDGACVTAPGPTQINVLRILPTSGLVEVGDTLQLHLIGFRLDGSSYPLAEGDFTVVDANAPDAGVSAAATVSAAGVMTGVSAGQVTVRAKVVGSVLPPVEATFTVVPQLASGRRVLVVDAATKKPLGGAKVMGCEVANCDFPLAVDTDTDGVAAFTTLGAGSASFTVVSPTLRSDGLEQYERASVVGTTAGDVYLPLRANPAQAAAGFNGSLSFSKVSTNGTYWAGFMATSFNDVAAVRPTDLLGDTFSVQLDVINQKIPVPGAVVLYTSPAFGVPQEVKPRSFGFSEAGTRFVVGYAGRGELINVLSARSVDFLGYLGAFDYALDTQLTLKSLPDVPDTADVNGNGLCTSPTRCPMGTENVPDYANFTRVSMTPSRQQALRTEVAFPRVPQAVSSVLVSAVEVDSEAGLLPVGFASRTPGAPGTDNTRPVDSVTLRSGPPYNGLEVARPGLWAVATNTQATALSARLSRYASMPAQVTLPTFMPWPANDSYSPVSRTFSPGQPAWASVYSSGGEFARVSIVGTEQRHVLYFATQAGQTAVKVPATPSSAGQDPLGLSMSGLEVVVFDLSAGVTVDDVFTLHGANLSNLASSLDGYSRADR